MGLSKYMLEAVVREHCYRPIRGSVVQIGRQSMDLTIPETRELFRRYRLPLDRLDDRELEIDRNTTMAHQIERQLISDQSLFKAIGAEEVRAVDHSDFEGADIIHDLNRPIGPSLENIADLVLDGSTLDNVHDPATALINYNRMLRPGGRVVSINAAKPDVQGAYTGMAVEWFLDYYAVNDYADCRVYAQLNFPDLPWTFPSGPRAFLAVDYQWVIENGRAPAVDHEGWAFAIVVAEKGTTSTWDRVPRRAGLRSKDEQEEWVAVLRRFAASNRPCHLETERPDFPTPTGFRKAEYDVIAQQPNHA